MITEPVMYIVIRSDLGMSPGKAAAQVGHAVQLAIRHAEKLTETTIPEWLATWEAGSYTKIVLSAKDEDELKAVASSPFWRAVVDEGRTELAGKNVTCWDENDTRCRRITLRAELPDERALASIEVDLGQTWGQLETMPEFGCVLFEGKTLEERPAIHIDANGDVSLSGKFEVVE
jgi:peptidyl-tRNA hydrolase